MSYNATSRTNYFSVKAADQFLAALENFKNDIEIHKGTGEHVGKFMISGEGDDGCFPSTDPSDESFESIDFTGIVAEHLQDGEIAVFISAGADKLREVGGYAEAITNSGERVEVSLESILTLATEKFGKTPSPPCW